MFFFPKSVKKKHMFFFFPGIVYQPLTQFFLAALLIIKRKIMIGLFFFSAQIFVFFSQEKFKLHSHTRLKSLFFFPNPEKKRLFYSLTRFFSKMCKTQTYAKKNGTFAPTSPNFYTNRKLFVHFFTYIAV